MLEYLDNVVIPYVAKKPVRTLSYLNDHVALAIFDVFAAQRCDTVLIKLSDNHTHQVFVPASCTGELQPLDISTNETFKTLMKDSFTRWYAQEVHEALDSGKSVHEVKIDLRLSMIKPLHANWLITAHSILKHKTAVLTRGFEQAGILDCV